MADLSGMTEPQLNAELKKLMKQRGDAEMGFKTKMHAIQQELNVRSATAIVTAQLSALDPDLRAQVLAEMGD